MVISLFGSRGFRGLLGVAPVETIDAARSIDQLLLTGKERMAGRTNFHVQVVFAGGTSLKGLAAGAGNCDFFIFRMNSGFHFLLTLYSRQYSKHFKQPIIRAAYAHRQGTESAPGAVAIGVTIQQSRLLP